MFTLPRSPMFVRSIAKGRNTLCADTRLATDQATQGACP
ncbi:hypothetical protein SAMN05216255_1060 [Pseudomonas segetis]|uniref:Uncharacterized protein n=1 Tax=Pseudomonas segetis TaxID=298908 RepID=A0A239ABF8_9PSED|nr:hypothetical protein SAMN05216255_1060 [Pseudomonas segetis]